MADDRINPIIVFRTGQVWEMDVATDALKKAGIPHFCQEETSGGLRLAMPISPAPGPGVWYSLLVPEPKVEKARYVLSQLSFEIKTDPDVWDFKPGEKGKKVWKAWSFISLLLILLFLVLSFFRW